MYNVHYIFLNSSETMRNIFMNLILLFTLHSSQTDDNPQTGQGSLHSYINAQLKKTQTLFGLRLCRSFLRIYEVVDIIIIMLSSCLLQR
jgi:hypothetical protein